MKTPRRLRGISAVIVAEYGAAAVAVMGLLWLTQGPGTRPNPACLQECGPNGAPVALAAYGLIDLLVGLPIAFVLITVRHRRDESRRRASTKQAPPRNVVVEGTTAAWRGVLIGSPVVCLLSVPLTRLLS
jgi:hypothetical protein